MFLASWIISKESEIWVQASRHQTPDVGRDIGDIAVPISEQQALCTNGGVISPSG